jgi:tape measure domain-containing protein
MGFTVDIKGNASHLDKTIKNVKTSLSAIGSVATTAATSLAGIGVAGGAAMTAFIVSSSKAAADVEDLGIQFEVLTGSAKTAAELMKTFRDEEKKSALNLSDYANAAKTMLAFGTSVDDVTPSLRMLGDVSMGNSERFGSLALAFAQTTAAGRLMGQEVLQFVNAGFNPLEQISRDTGRSMQDLKKDMEDGAITVDMVKKAFVSATSEGGRFYKAIDKGSASTNAKLNQVSAAATQLQVAFGTGFNNGLKDALDATNTYLPQLQQRFTDAGNMIGIAMTESIQGNHEKFILIGETVGTIISAGIHAGIITGLDNLGESLGKLLAYGAENLSVQSIINPSAAKKTGSAIREATSGSTNFSEQIGNAMDAYGANALLQKVNTELEIAKAVKKGTLDTNMSTAVREGVLQAFSKQPQGAKFSN